MMALFGRNLTRAHAAMQVVVDSRVIVDRLGPGSNFSINHNWQLVAPSELLRTVIPTQESSYDAHLTIGSVCPRAQNGQSPLFGGMPENRIIVISLLAHSSGLSQVC